MQNKKTSLCQTTVSPDLVCLAEITSAYGIRGNLKLRTYTKNPTDISRYANLQDQFGGIYRLHLLSSPNPHSTIVAIHGITDRNQAEELKGVKLYVKRSDLPELEEEEFYYTDLIGMDVQDEKTNPIGKVQGVYNYGAGDFLDITTPLKEPCSIPFRRESVPSIDLLNRSLSINSVFLLKNKE